MEGHLKFNLILLVLLMSVFWIQAASRREEYTALEPGQNITGKVAEISTINPMDCIRRYDIGTVNNIYMWTYKNIRNLHNKSHGLY